MFDPIGSFTRQFEPVDGGYLYYPSRKSGGKLVTAEEFEQLVSDWQRVAGTRGTWKSAGLIGLAILVWTLLSRALALSEWTDWVIIVGCVVALSGWVTWASLAPRRLVRGRPDVAPPRPASQIRREVRATFNWPFVIFALLLSGLLFFGALESLSGTLAGWAFVVGSGLLFGVYVWTAFQKLRDPKRRS
jgi:hypothetical protein